MYTVELENLVKAINEQVGTFVITGSKAFQLHRIDEDVKTKDIDIIVAGSTLPTDWRVLSPKFNSQRACKKIEGQWVECWLLNKLPEYTTININNTPVKVRTLKSMMYHYLSLNIEECSVKFQKKIKKRKNWSEQYLRTFQ